ncbi:MAG: c-type cytochrome [Burkholderiales bacterium]
MAAKSSLALIRHVALFVAAACVSGAAHGDDRPKNPFAGDKAIASEGGSLLNQYCSHCHGQWAEQGERPRDLRRLNLRYGDDAITTFYRTVNNGRLEKGMPVWKGVLSEETLWKIYTFLESVQSEE